MCGWCKHWPWMNASVLAHPHTCVHTHTHTHTQGGRHGSVLSFLTSSSNCSFPLGDRIVTRNTRGRCKSRKNKSILQMIFQIYLTWKSELEEKCRSHERSSKGIQLICQCELPWFVFAVFKHNISSDKRRIIRTPGLILVLRRSKPSEWPKYRKNGNRRNTNKTALVSVSCAEWEVTWTVWKMIWECIKDIFFAHSMWRPGSVITVALWLLWGGSRDSFWVGGRCLAVVRVWKGKKPFEWCPGFDTVQSTPGVGGTGLSSGPGDVIKA